MDHSTVRIILEKVISSPVSVKLAEFDESIQWVEDRGSIRQLDREPAGMCTARHSRQQQLKCVFCVGLGFAVGSPEPRILPNVC